MQDIVKSLKNIGLSENESLIYLSILKGGSLNISEIARKTRIKRTTVTNYITEMLNRGLISRNIRGKRMNYIAESPEKILRDYDQRRERFISTLPELNNLFRKASHKANIRYFEGKSGILDIYREISLGFLPISTFYSLDRFLALFKKMDAMDEFITNIVKNENSVRDLIEDTERTRNIMKYRGKKEKKWKYLPKDFKLCVDVLIQGDKIALISFGSEMGIIIENDEIAQYQKQTFEFMWQHLE